jgi:hypothetical protein
MSHSAEINALADKSGAFAAKHGADVAAAMEDAVQLMLAWLNALSPVAASAAASELFHAMRAMIRESVALLGLGLARPCLFSMRGQIDLVLAWLYFKDHPVEYALVRRTGEGYKLKREILLYLKEYYPNYGSKFGILFEIRTRAEADPYRLLSAHVHAQSDLVVPAVDGLAGVVSEIELARDCIKLQRDVAEYVSDQLFAVGLLSQPAVPKVVLEQILKRSKTNAQRASLFTG